MKKKVISIDRKILNVSEILKTRGVSKKNIVFVVLAISHCGAYFTKIRLFNDHLDGWNVVLANGVVPRAAEQVIVLPGDTTYEVTMLIVVVHRREIFRHIDDLHLGIVAARCQQVRSAIVLNKN